MVYVVPEHREIPISGLVWRLSMRWRSAIDRAIAPLGLTHAQYALVAPLLGMDRVGRRPTQRELADSTGLEPLYVSKLARGLAAAGLLERAPHPQDSRAVQLALTDRGREIAVRAVDEVVALQADLTAALGGPASPATTELIAALRTLLDTPADPTGPADPTTHHGSTS